MRKQRTLRLGTFAAALLLVGLGLLTSACGPEEYGPCTLPRSEALNDACSSQTSEGEAGVPTTKTNPSCVIDFVFECESQLCGTFNGSDAFCTERCLGEGDTACPKNGTCLEWVPGLGEYFCVPSDMVPSAQ